MASRLAKQTRQQQVCFQTTFALLRIIFTLFTASDLESSRIGPALQLEPATQRCSRHAQRYTAGFAKQPGQTKLRRSCNKVGRTRSGQHVNVQLSTHIKGTLRRCHNAGASCQCLSRASVLGCTAGWFTELRYNSAPSSLLANVTPSEVAQPVCNA